MKILIIDSDIQLVKTLTQHLMHKGYTVVNITDGKEGWKYIKTNINTIDIILADVNAANLNGIKILKNIHDNNYEIPLILMTNSNDLDIAIQALRNGAFDLILKNPYEISVLDRILGRITSLFYSKQQLCEILPYYQGKFECVIPSKIKYIETCTAFIHSQIKSFCLLNNIDFYKISLCLQESLANAIIHGNLEISSSIKEQSWDAFEELKQKHESIPEYSNRIVKIQTKMNPDKLEFEITDEGKGFDYTKIPDINDPTLWLNASGRGLMIISSFMDEMKWNTEGNSVKMVKFCNSAKKC